MNEKLVDLQELSDFGYLQEVNRTFFHPLGMALVLWHDESGVERGVYGVLDCRSDQEGVIFDDGQISVEKYENVMRELNKRKAARISGLGYFLQPVTKDDNVVNP